MGEALTSGQSLQSIKQLRICSYYYISVVKKYLKRNPKWLFMYVLGRFKFVQVLMISYYQRRHATKAYDERDSVFKDFHTTEVVKSLNTDGLYLGINLPKSYVAEILEFVRNNDCYGDGDLKFGFAYAEKTAAKVKYNQAFRLGKYYNASLLCPAIQKLASDPKLLNIAAGYLGVEPLHAGSWLWWSFPEEVTTNQPAAAVGQIFHYDIEDYRCLRFYFYLTDTDLDSGPHVCIRSSHNQKKLGYLLSLLRLRSEQDLIAYYGAEKVVTICGQAGFGFAEDPFCMHKGLPPTRRDRLILAVHFSITDYGILGDHSNYLLTK